jgi:predicted dehydrogenase
MSTRRIFLKRSAGVAGIAGAPFMASAAQDTASPNDRIGVALIGCGSMGRGNLSQFIRQKEVECVAVCDVDDSRAEQARKLVETAGKRPPELVTRDFRRVLERKDVHAVIVATPDHWHAIPTIMACQAGKDVYVQKPMATSIGEAKAMLDAARKYARVVEVGTQQRSMRQFQQCVSYVRSGKLGQLRQVRCYAYLSGNGELKTIPDENPPAGVDYEMWLGPAPKRPFNRNRFHNSFRYFWDYAGGCMMDWGAHMIDIALWAMGGKPPLSAVSVGGKYVWPNDAKETPDTQHVLYELPGFVMTWEGALGISHGPGASNPNEHGVMFYGQNGVALVDRWGWEVFPEADRFPSAASEYRSAALPRRNITNEPSAHERNFLDCMRSRQRPIADVEDGYTCMVACHMGNMALRLGRKIRWNAQTNQVIDDPEAQKMATYQYRAPWKLSI